MSLKKNITYKILASLAAIVLLIAGIAILGYYAFFPAKITLTVAGYNSANKLFDSIDKNMTLFEDRYLSPILKNTIQEETRAGISIDEKLLSLFLPSDMAADTLHYINNMAYKCDRQVDIKNRKQSREFGISYLLNPIITTRVSFEGDRFNFGVDELSNKTITGNMEDLERLSSFFPDIPQEYWNSIKNIDPWITAKILEQIKIDRKTVKTIMFNYSNEALNSINTKDMTIKRGTKTEVLGENIKCNEITIKLGENSQKELASNILDRLKSDDRFYNLTAGNVIKCLNIIGENEYYKDLISSYNLAEMLSKDNYTKSISKLENEILIATLPEITLKVYIDGLDIVKCSVTTDAEADGQRVSYISQQRFNGPSFTFELFISSNNNKNETLLQIRKDYNKPHDINNYAFKLDIDNNLPDNSIHGSISIDSVEEPNNKNEIEHTLEALIEYDMPALMGNGSLNIDLNGTKTKDSKKQVIERDYKGNLVLNIPFLSADIYSLGFYYDTEAVYGKEITIPVPDDILDLKTATEEEFNQLTEEIGMKIEAFGQLTGAF